MVEDDTITLTDQNKQEQHFLGRDYTTTSASLPKKEEKVVAEQPTLVEETDTFATPATRSKEERTVIDKFVTHEENETQASMEN